jgi:ribosomal protein S18 acetylase RimI-like enzyme
MTGRDLDEIMQIELQSFTLPWSRQSYENELNNRYATYIVADYEGEVAREWEAGCYRPCSILPGKNGSAGFIWR